MFELREYQKEVDCKTLEHSREVFHHALEDGGTYYHVHNPNGTDYDITYKKNHDYYKDLLPVYIQQFEAFPDYRTYDEDDPSTMQLGVFQIFTRYICLQVNEYSLALAYVILRYTDREVYFKDPRALWFLEPHARLHVGEVPPAADGDGILTGPLGPTFQSRIIDKISDLALFHSLFTIQWILDGRQKEQIRYVEIPASKVAGIGSVLGMFSRTSHAFWPLGWKAIYKGDYISKFPARELEKYFRLDLNAPDATPDNTILLSNMVAVNMSWMYTSASAAVTTDIFTDKFRSDLEEYYDSVIGQKKALGVLIRGTDYIASNLTGIRKMATVEQMLPTLKEWLVRDGYDVIFLATEDQTALDQMRQAFGDRLIAVAQERHSVDEFTDVKVISDLERKLYSEEEYNDRIMDTTINYIYAMYLLSRCDSFIASGQCSGVDMVLALNENRFHHYYRFEMDATSVNLES